ncbi:urea carboxylase [Mycobacterium sp. MAA66]|uniref:5-oxoprolinase/urea amidolyase family protein n=1 Tax=Mycobacterium sp. MAA66 TaxID=3156297 RepID=UPI003513D4AB
MTQIEVLRPGMLTTVQDWPGRVGYWNIGVPPSGPMDDLSFRIGNRVLLNPEGTAGLECTKGGPALRFPDGGRVCVSGAPVTVTVDGVPVPQWQSITVPAGGVLDVGMVNGPGMRCYVLVAGGLLETEYLGSTSTFTMGAFGGHHGRKLAGGDVLTAGTDRGPHQMRPDRDARAAIDELPAIGTHWEVAVTEGPHGAPEFFTRSDIDTILRTHYTVHFNSDRTGVRLEGPKPQWARTDGGEAGLHPSNIHDNAYCVGALDFTGDTPILLGPDGPSLGGFVCPVTVARADRWKLGQMAPGDTVRFVAVRADRAPSPRTIDHDRRASLGKVFSTGGDGDDGVLSQFISADGTAVTLRRAGDGGVLVEYGPMVLDLAMRARVHVLYEQLQADQIPGITEMTPGVRSLQVQFDPEVLSMSEMVELLAVTDQNLPASDQLVVPSRAVRLPLSWDDPATHEAIERYMNGVRADAPWCPDNIEFIRRVNGLADRSEVYETVYRADYLVLGLGDVYLGAPVATPLDPRHRLVTTKYNPARTWTAENSVGIGGAYMCIYGMEGPGGYQFVGRTTQVWNHCHPADAAAFEPGTPWLLRFFDRINFYPVSAAELLDLRADMAAGRGHVEITDGEFSLAGYQDFLAANAEGIATFRAQQSEAFGAERAAWDAAGELSRTS